MQPRVVLSTADLVDSMTPLTRTISHWKLRSRSLELGRRTLVMGVINITPDSFSDGGLFLTPEAAVARALQLLDEGADLLDLGAESTRPGSPAGNVTEAAAAVSADEEQARLLPVIEEILAARPDAILSADTYKSATALAALAAGAEIINDVSGFSWDEAMPSVCAQSACGVILMHTRGTPRPVAHTGEAAGGYADRNHPHGIVGEPCDRHSRRDRPGVYRSRPRLRLSARSSTRTTPCSPARPNCSRLGRPLLAGVSRKSFLGHTLAPLFGGTQAPIEAREIASIAALVAAILHGASIVRVHDVRPAVEAARIADAVLTAR